jgi:hypothetical protein
MLCGSKTLVAARRLAAKVLPKPLKQAAKMIYKPGKATMIRLDWSKYDGISKAVETAPEEYRPHKHWLDFEKRAAPRLRAGLTNIVNLTDAEGVYGWVGGGLVTKSAGNAMMVILNLCES